MYKTILLGMVLEANATTAVSDYYSVAVTIIWNLIAFFSKKNSLIAFHKRHIIAFNKSVAAIYIYPIIFIITNQL